MDCEILSYVSESLTVECTVGRTEGLILRTKALLYLTKKLRDNVTTGFQLNSF